MVFLFQIDCKNVITSGQHPSFYITLNTDLKVRAYDMLSTGLAHLLPDQYFPRDILRYLFDYLMVSFVFTFNIYVNVLLDQLV